jgi:hypothetical protein
MNKGEILKEFVKIASEYKSIKAEQELPSLSPRERAFVEKSVRDLRKLAEEMKGLGNSFTADSAIFKYIVPLSKKLDGVRSDVESIFDYVN